VNLEVRGAGVVDEAAGPADVHSVTNVLAGDELWVEPDLVALGVVFDCSFVLFDLLSVLFDLIGVKSEELCFDDEIYQSPSSNCRHLDFSSCHVDRTPRS